MDTTRARCTPGFTSDDIIANRQGRMTEAQLAHHVRQYRWASVKGLLLAGFAATGLVVWALLGGASAWIGGALLVVLVAVVVGRDRGYRRRLMNAQVERADGPVVKTTDGAPTSRAAHYLQIKDRTPRFRVTADLYHDLDEHMPYTLYYLRDMRTLLSVDAPRTSHAPARAHAEQPQQQTS